MPQRVNAQSDIGTSKVSSDSYDVDNIFLTDQGWVYRHWKDDPTKTDARYWDEIIVAGQVPADDGTGTPVVGDVPFETTIYERLTVDENGLDVMVPAGSQKYGNPLANGGAFETKGDGSFDFEYSPEIGETPADGVARYPYPDITTSSTPPASTPPASTPSDVTLVFTGAVGTDSYTSAGGENASVTIEAGGTLTITNNTGGHPADVRVSDGGATVTTGTLTGAPAGPGESLTWDTTGVTPGTYYYQCTAHSTMIGEIIVT